MSSNANDLVVRLHEEGVSVDKKRVITGRVRISTVTRQEEVPVDELLRQESVEVERKTLNRPVDKMPPVREEGDTLVIPVVEEVLVVERRLILREEVRVRRTQQTTRHQEQVKIRKQEVQITRPPIEAETGAEESAARE